MPCATAPCGAACPPRHEAPERRLGAGRAVSDPRPDRRGRSRLIDPTQPRLSHQLHAAWTRRRNDRQATTACPEAGKPALEQTPTPTASRQSTNNVVLRLTKPAPHGVGVQGLRPPRGRPPADPGPRRLIGAPERQRRPPKERSTRPKLGLDRPRSFRNDTEGSR